ncbi:MAG: hypothetical protein ACI92Z_003702 [Paracoccaceae bacterium]
MTLLGVIEALRPVHLHSWVFTMHQKSSCNWTVSSVTKVLTAVSRAPGPALCGKREMKTSIIAGATGLVGTELVKALEAKSDPVIVLARRPMPDLSSNTKWLETDFDDLVDGGSLPSCDHVYICLGTTMKKVGSKDAFWKVDFEYCLAVAKRARESGATTLSLVSSVGANAASKNFYLHTKGALEDAITALDFPTVNIYRPSLLLGNRAERRPLEALGIILFRAIGPLFVGSLRKYRGIEVELLAATMVENTNKRSKAPTTSISRKLAAVIRSEPDKFNLPD